MLSLLVNIILIVLALLWFSKGVFCTDEQVLCEYYDNNECKRNSSLCFVTTIDCQLDHPASPQQRHGCYVLWYNSSDMSVDTSDTMQGVFEHGAGITVIKKGCWLDSVVSPMCSNAMCVARSQDAVVRNNFYCCCTGNLCNVDFTFESDNSVDPTQRSPSTAHDVAVKLTSVKETNDSRVILKAFLISLLPLLAITVLIVVVYYLYRRHKQQFTDQHESAVKSPAAEALLQSVDHADSCCCHDIKLLEMTARGRYGAVWRAQMSDGRVVAVKIFPETDGQSWSAERQFYALPAVAAVRHPNILRFMCAERRPSSELWLVTDYHELGSLYDHLRKCTMTREQLVNVALSISRGLAFLHSSTLSKLPIAHRDVKSRNVLLRSNMTACIADFGLAMELTEHLGVVHGQVGTRRYMSPEVLDCSISFTAECFLKIDIYACSLVLWELLSRCSLETARVAAYKMPFEDIVGLQPSLEQMQAVVIQNKQRPQLQAEWLKHELLSAVCTLVEECWDEDPEARLSAECIEERLLSLNDTLLASQQQVSPGSPARQLLITPDPPADIVNCGLPADLVIV